MTFSKLIAHKSDVTDAAITILKQMQNILSLRKLNIYVALELTTNMIQRNLKLMLMKMVS